MCFFIKLGKYELSHVHYDSPSYRFKLTPSHIKYYLDQPEETQTVKVKEMFKLFEVKFNKRVKQKKLFLVHVRWRKVQDSTVGGENLGISKYKVSYL